MFLFFWRETENVSHDEIMTFTGEKNTPVKKPKNAIKIARVNHFLPAKLSENRTREKKMVHVKKTKRYPVKKVDFFP